MNWRGLVSFEIGARKPEAEIYAYAIEALGVKPGNVAFFDDALPNIVAANRFGMRAFHTCEPAGVLDVLEKELGFWGGSHVRKASLSMGDKGEPEDAKCTGAPKAND
jgi:FMN phosphatase YigB (HAD superfamily)